MTEDIAYKGGDLKGRFAVHLWFYDENRGHCPLFSFPDWLMQEPREKRIISVHSIWWLHESGLGEKERSHVDLEIGGRVYSAVEIVTKSMRTKKRSGMAGTPELFVLIVSSPSSISFLGMEMSQFLLERVSNEIGDNLGYLTAAACGEDDETHEIAKEIKRKLQDICEEIIPKVSLERVADDLVLGRDILTDKEERILSLLAENIQTSGMFPRTTPERVPIVASRKEILIDSVELEAENRLAVKAKNISDGELQNVVVSVTEVHDFFEETSWSTTVPKWEENANMIFKFNLERHCDSILKIEDTSDIILIQKFHASDYIDEKYVNEK